MGTFIKKNHSHKNYESEIEGSSKGNDRSNNNAKAQRNRKYIA